MAWPPFSRRAAALAVLVLAVGLAARADEEDRSGEEWVRPHSGRLPDAYDGGACFLVRDARTGKPLEGVTVQRCPEMELGPRGWGPVAGTWTTDVHGLVHVDLPEGVGDSHWVFRKPGYGTTEEYGAFLHEVVDLVPGRTRHGRVVDFLGRPVAGLVVEHKIGCAHSPAIHEAQTDGNGEFVFHEVGEMGDVTVAGAGVEYAYHGEDLRPLDTTPSEIRVEPGVTVIGRVEITDGQLLPPRTLLSMTTWRGPLAALAADGSFRIEGTDGESLLQLHHWLRTPQGDPETPQLGLDEYRPGGPIFWRVGRAAEDEEEALETVPQAFTVLGPDGSPLAGVEVHFDRLAGGRRFSARSDTFEDVPVPVVDLPPGRYEVSAGGPFARWVSGTVDATVPAREPIRLVAREQPRLVVTREGCVGDPSPQGTLYLEGARTPFETDPTPSGEDGPCLPADAPAWVVLPSAVGTARAPVGPAKDGRRTARLVFPAPRWIQVEDVWHGEAVEIDLHDGGLQVVERKDGVLRLATGESGRLPLHLAHPEFGWGWAVVDVPPGGDAAGVVDLGTVRWSGGPTLGDLVIEPPAGRRLDEPTIDARYVPPHGLGAPYDGHSLEGANQPDGSVRITSAALRAGVDLVVKPCFQGGDRDEEWVPCRVRLEGEGPYRVEIPAGGLDLEILLSDAEEDDVSVIVDGHLEHWGEIRGGRLLAKLRGLRTGPHEVLVGSPGHQGREARVVLKAGEVRRLRIELPTRPH